MLTEKLPSFDEIPFFTANFIFSFGKKWNMEHPSKMQLMSCSKPLLKWSNFLLKWHLLSISLYQSNADIIGFENTKDPTEMWLRILQICGWGFYKKNDDDPSEMQLTISSKPYWWSNHFKTSFNHIYSS